jgi:hypothetical protein
MSLEPTALLRSPRARLAAIFAALAAVVAVLLVVDPTKTHILPGCWFHAMTGLYCPGCGATRALFRLIRGEPIDALRYNALLVVVMPWLAFRLGRYAVGAMTGRTWPAGDGRWDRVLAALFIGFFVVRNLPAWPFVLLAPPA